MLKEHVSARAFVSSVSPKPRLTILPYDILYKILSLVLPTLPQRIALTLNKPEPPWLEMFTSHCQIIRCPPIILVCRLLTRHCFRILYTHPQLSINAGRSHLARLSRLRARRYIRKLDLALERQLRPNSKQNHELLQRQNTSCPDIVSFYSPAYLVDLLHRIFPRLRSVSLTVVETCGSEHGRDGKPMNCPSGCKSADAEPLHYFALAAFTQSANIDPAMWNNSITAIRYKRCYRPDNPQAGKSSFFLGSRPPFQAPRRRGATDDLEEEVSVKRLPTLNATTLPNLSHVGLYLTTCRSFVDDKVSKVSNHWTEHLQLEQHLQAIRAMVDLNREDVELKIYRIVIHRGSEKRQETGSEPLEQHLIDALLPSLREAKGKGKKGLLGDDMDERW